jgi:FkbM family methyltransferase
MIVNTQRLFARLLRAFQINAVCDVGSMNGADALAFRNAVPGSSVYAFEPNPENFRRMAANPVFQERNIQIVSLAATNYDGEAEFFLVAADYSVRDGRSGMSSLYRRSDEEPAAVVRINTTRLDTFLADKCPSGLRLALWIDTEGKAHEVIEGITGVVQHVHLLHVEVEAAPCIGMNQRLYPEVKALLHRLGFAELATDQARSHPQFNVLFVRHDLGAGMQFQVTAYLAWARLRRLVTGTLWRLCPACLRRYQVMRLKASYELVT